jgi:hypothetical protein
MVGLQRSVHHVFTREVQDGDTNMCGDVYGRYQLHPRKQNVQVVIQVTFPENRYGVTTSTWTINKTQKRD